MTKQTAVKTKTEESKSVAVKLFKIKGVNLDTGASVFTVPLSALYVEAGYNVRELDQDHVLGFVESYKNKAHVPAIAVRHTETGLKVIEGHHRFDGATQAKVKTVNIELFTGTEQDAVAYMITSSQGRNLEPLERAEAYARLIADGMKKTELSKFLGRSRTDIDRHLTLLTASTRIKNSLAKGEIGFKAVVTTLKAAKTPEDLAEANKTLETAVKQAKQINKTVTTKVLADAKAAPVIDLPEKIVTSEKPVVGLAGDKNIVGKETADKNAPPKFTLEDGLKIAEILAGYETKWLTDVNIELVALVNKYVAAGN